MIIPHTEKEKILLSKGYRLIAGVDEAGRGALAGPVVSAAVIMPEVYLKDAARLIKGVKDSKLLSSPKREEIFAEILKVCLGYGIGIVEHRLIDKINIYQATRLAMKRAVENIWENDDTDPESSTTNIFKTKVDPDYLLIDAMRIETAIPQKSIIKGDNICYSIALASIIAKVIRDRLMLKLHSQYPRYRFDLHKGYGTKIHMEALKKYGPCAVHRLTFKPVMDVAH